MCAAATTSRCECSRRPDRRATRMQKERAALRPFRFLTDRVEGSTARGGLLRRLGFAFRLLRIIRRTVQPATLQQRTDLRPMAGEVLEQHQRILAAAAREQGVAEVI